MTRRRLFLLLGLAIAALAVLLLATSGFGLWAKRDRGLTLYGNVDIRQVDLGFRVAGRIAAMPIEEGAHVKAGTRLAMLDTRPFDDRHASAVAQVDLAAADLDKRRNGNRAQDIAQAQAMLAQQQANLAKAREDYERRKPLIATGAISQALFDQTTAALRAAQAQVDAATQALSLQRAGSRREDIAAGVAQLESAHAQRATALTDLADTALVAPADGTILTRAREPGAIVQAGETVFTLTIDRPVRVRAYVGEADLGRVAPGMKVTVTTDGNAKVYHGAIGYISPAAEFTPKTVETTSLRSDLVYRLRIIVADPDERLRQGQPVTVGVPDAPPASKR
ncbi:secretion protein HlyD [Sphingomonas sp. H39-1-10]|uniref:secretion protein HlyD n=1 Tax=Sphingomonas pollutisoli TaxID=3030829 RepID=UPI0023BA05D7|nr:secretion protein HlyD [Sphingomonas pollutisoli]MDF0491442.1 secretion protein HlyD [Sphingomonas pollutisoli]